MLDEPDSLPLWIVLSCHSAIALGTMFGGWRIVRTMGNKLTRLQPMGGVCAESAAAAALFFTSYNGIPVSTTHTITGAIVGVGSANRMSAVRWNVARRVVWAWVFTIPGAAVVAMLAYWFLALGELMDRRAVFFLCSAVVCLLMSGVTPASLQWVGQVMAIAYAVLAAASWLDHVSRRRSNR